MSTSKRGFASMDPEKRRLIAAMGGKAVPNEKRSFSRDNSLAKAAGIKGGSAVPPEKRIFSRDRKLAVESGRRGGSATSSKSPAKGRADS